MAMPINGNANTTALLPALPPPQQNQMTTLDGSSVSCHPPHFSQQQLHASDDELQQLGDQISLQHSNIGQQQERQNSVR